MPEAFVASGGQWRTVRESLLSSAGQWRAADQATIADSGQWRSAWSAGPSPVVTATPKSSAPWSRIDFTLSAEGSWDTLIVTATTDGSPAVVLKILDPAPPPGTSVNIAGTSPLLVPGKTYTVRARWTYGSVSGESEPVLVAMSAPPKATQFSNRTITDVSGGKNWVSFEDVKDWNTQRINDNTRWFHGGDKPYVNYSSGLSASTKYRFKTQANVNDVWGAWSDEFSFTTLAPQYTPGEYYIPVDYVNCHQTGRSGGQSAGWQDSSRSYWYAGNGDSWGSTRGVQRTLFWYSKSNNVMVAVRNALAKGARISNAWLYLSRSSSSHGVNTGIQQAFAVHKTSYANAPVNHNGNGISWLSGGKLSRGSAAWIEFPASYAHLVCSDAGLTYRGIMLGDYNSSNVYCAYNKGGSLGVMKVKIV